VGWKRVDERSDQARILKLPFRAEYLGRTYFPSQPMTMLTCQMPITRALQL